MPIWQCEEMISVAQEYEIETQAQIVTAIAVLFISIILMTY